MVLIHVLKYKGQVYHLLGPLDAQNKQQPKYLHMYFMGNTEVEVRQRIEILLSANLNTNIISELQNMLHCHNIKINNFKNILMKIIKS